MGQDHLSRSTSGRAGGQAEWRRRLKALVKRAEALPVRRDDLDVVVADITDPDAGDAELLAALREAVLARLGGYGAPGMALAAALEELSNGPTEEATMEAVGHCARLVAEAFARSVADAAAFARRAVEA
jgi:ATP-dependent RNA helicase SUPV3L1/SUV3